MKNKRIYFDDTHWGMIFSSVMAISSLTIFILNFDMIPPWGYIILTITFSLFLTGVKLFSKLGIHFNYRTKTIKYFGQTKIKKNKILMGDVLFIDFIELAAVKQKGMPPDVYITYGRYSLDKVYRNGKIFMFNIHLVNGEVIKIPYFHLFKAVSRHRVSRQETKIKTILKEFNQYIEKLRME